jgi:site-specific DNA recombinase
MERGRNMIIERVFTGTEDFMSLMAQQLEKEIEKIVTAVYNNTHSRRWKWRRQRMKVAGYIRVSTNKEGQKESPENQKRLILNFLEENQYDLYDFYTDVETGTTDNREGLKKLIRDAENKQFDIIVAKELSRLGGNVELLYQLKRIAETKGVRLITLDGRVDTQDLSKQTMFGLYAWVYESESQRISD